MTGGPPETLAAATAGLSLGGTWNEDSVIVFASIAERGSNLFRVSAAGGEPSPVLELDESSASVRGSIWPQFLPDGRHFLFLSLVVGQAQHEDNGIYVGSLDSPETTRVIGTTRIAKYAAPGYLLFTRDTALMAQRFDTESLTLTGEPMRIVDEVSVNAQTGLVGFSVSDHGDLAYRAQGTTSVTQLTWFDRSGAALGEASEAGLYSNPALSPDETRVAVERVAAPGEPADIWMLDLTRGTTSRFTFEPGVDQWPTWSPDGSQIVYSAQGEDGLPNLYRKNASGTGEPELLLDTAGIEVPVEWSRNGERLTFYDLDVRSGNLDLWVLPFADDREPIPFPSTPFAEHSGRLSPDGRWMAYMSDESGQDEVYVQGFPSFAARDQMDGGVEGRTTCCGTCERSRRRPAVDADSPAAVRSQKWCRQDSTGTGSPVISSRSASNGTAHSDPPARA